MGRKRKPGDRNNRSHDGQTAEAIGVSRSYYADFKRFVRIIGKDHPLYAQLAAGTITLNKAKKLAGLGPSGKNAQKLTCTCGKCPLHNTRYD